MKGIPGLLIPLNFQVLRNQKEKWVGGQNSKLNTVAGKRVAAEYNGKIIEFSGSRKWAKAYGARRRNKKKKKSREGMKE